MNNTLSKLLRILNVFVACVATGAYIALIYYSVDLVQKYKNIDSDERCFEKISDDEYSKSHLSADSIGNGIAITFVSGFAFSCVFVYWFVYVFLNHYEKFLQMGTSIVIVNIGSLLTGCCAHVCFCYFTLMVQTVFTTCFRENFAYDTKMIIVIVAVNSFVPVIAGLTLLIGSLAGCLILVYKLICAMTPHNIFEFLCCPCIWVHKYVEGKEVSNNPPYVDIDATAQV